MSSRGDSLSSAVFTKTYASISSDTDLVAQGGGPSRRIRVGGGGNLALDYGNGVTDTITSLLAGESLDVCAQKILASGTTATQLTVHW